MSWHLAPGAQLALDLDPSSWVLSAAVESGSHQPGQLRNALSRPGVAKVGLSWHANPTPEG